MNLGSLAVCFFSLSCDVFVSFPVMFGGGNLTFYCNSYTILDQCF